jgi:hypothetical protein
MPAAKRDAPGKFGGYTRSGRNFMSETVNLNVDMIRLAIAGQYGAAFKMLANCIETADAIAWNAPVGKVAFWHVAYHVTFTADLYLARDEHEFVPPAFHQPDSNFFGTPPWVKDRTVAAPQPYGNDVLIPYVRATHEKGRESVARETEATLAGPSGFGWLQITRLELHLYNIRHIQHHAGQLAAILRRDGGNGVPWAASEPG